MRQKYVLVAGFTLQLLAAFGCATASAALQDCSAVNYGSGLPVPLSPPWNVFSSNHELQLSASCEGQRAVINAGSNAGTQYVYNTGFYYQNNKWNRVTFNCASGAPAAGVWCAGSASAEISGVDRSQGSNYLAAFVCSLVDGQWKCGCNDGSCSAANWQIQAIKPEAVVPQSTGCAPAPSASLTENVRDHGAVGNGSHDDTAAIQSAIDRVAGTGGTVYVPAGTYRIDAVTRLRLKSNMTFKMANDAVLKAAPNGEPLFAILSVRSERNVNIIGGTVIGDRSEHWNSNGQWGMGVELMFAENVVIEGINSKDNWGDGIYVGQSSVNTTVCGVHADNNRRHGMAITRADGVVVKDSKFTNSHGIANVSAGIDVEPDDGDTAANVLIRNSDFSDNASSGILVGGRMNGGSTTRNVTVDGNRLTHNSLERGRAGLTISGAQDSTVSNNVVTGHATDGLTVVSGARGIKVANNTVRNNNGYGIIVYKASNNTVSGNVSENNGGYGISIYESPSNQVNNNSGSGNALGGLNEFPKGSSSIFSNNFN